MDSADSRREGILAQRTLPLARPKLFSLAIIGGVRLAIWGPAPVPDAAWSDQALRRRIKDCGEDSSRDASEEDLTGPLHRVAEPGLPDWTLQAL